MKFMSKNYIIVFNSVNSHTNFLNLLFSSYLFLFEQFFLDILLVRV